MMESETDLKVEFVIETQQPPLSPKASPTQSSVTHYDHCENRDPHLLKVENIDTIDQNSNGIQCNTEQTSGRSRVTLGHLDLDCFDNPQNIALIPASLEVGNVRKVRKKKPKRGRPPKPKEEGTPDSQNVPKKWKKEMIIRIYNEDGVDQFGLRKRGPKPKPPAPKVVIDPSVIRIYDENGIDQFGIRKPGRPRKRMQNTELEELGEPNGRNSVGDSKKRREDKRMVKEPERYQCPTNREDPDPVDPVVRIFDDYGVDQFGKMKRGRRPKGIIFKSRKPEKPADWVPRIYNEEGVDQFGEIKRGRPPKGIKWKPRAKKVKQSKPKKTVLNLESTTVNPSEGLSESLTSSEPLNLSENVNTSESVNPAELAKSSKALKSSKPVKSSKPGKSSKPTKSPKAGKSSKLEKSSIPTKPQKAEKSSKLEKSSEVGKSSNPTKSQKADKSSKLEKSSKPAKSSKSAESSETVKPTKLVYNEEGIDQFGRKRCGRKKGKGLRMKPFNMSYARQKRKALRKIQEAERAVNMTPEEIELERRKNIPPIFRTYNAEGVDEFGRKKANQPRLFKTKRRKKKPKPEAIADGLGRRPNYADNIVRIYNRSGFDQFGQRKRGPRAHLAKKKVTASIVPPEQEGQPVIPPKDRPKRELKMPIRLEMVADKPAPEPIKVAKPRKKKTSKKTQLKQTIPAMVVDAITNLRSRTGSSARAIKKYMREVFKCDTTKLNTRINHFLYKAEHIGVLFRSSGSGGVQVGRFKVAKKSLADFPQGRLKVLKKKKKKKKPNCKKGPSGSLTLSTVDLSGGGENFNSEFVPRASVIRDNLEDATDANEEHFTAYLSGDSVHNNNEEESSMSHLLPVSANATDLQQDSVRNDEEELPCFLMSYTTNHSNRDISMDELVSDPLAQDAIDVDSGYRREYEECPESELERVSSTDEDVTTRNAEQSSGSSNNSMNDKDDEDSSDSDDFE